MIQRAVTFRPVEILTIAFSAVLTATGLLLWPRVDGHASLFRIALAGAVPVAVAAVRARWPKRPRFVEVLLDFHIIAPILLVFGSLGPLIRAVNPVDRDGWLIAADRLFFGTDAARALLPLSTPFVSDVLTVFYALFFFHPIVLAALVYTDDLREPGRAGQRFERVGFLIVLTFYVSYAGYFAVPAVGPRYALDLDPLPRGTVSRGIDDALTKAETNVRDVFPSGHTMVVTAVLVEAVRRSRRTFLFFLPFAAGLIVSTVYCRYHYVVDVLAGLALTPPVLWLGDAWLKRYRAFPTIR